MKNKKTLSLLGAIIVAFGGYVATNTSEGNTKISSFTKAKKILATQVYITNKKTIYCGCAYTDTHNIDYNSCGYFPTSRANVEWEHVVPASKFGHYFTEWTEGSDKCVTRSGNKYKGRSCAGKNQDFAFMESDLHNLVPAVGKLNGYRSNYPVTIIPGEERRFGQCDFEVKDQKMEPRPEVRGDIARIYFYMNDTYGYDIVNYTNRAMLEDWDRNDPVDNWECQKNAVVKVIQGNSNKFVENYCTTSQP